MHLHICDNNSTHLYVGACQVVGCIRISPLTLPSFLKESIHHEKMLSLLINRGLTTQIKND